MNVNITGPRILAEFSFFGLCDVTITQTTLTSLLVLAAVTILCWRLGRNLRKRPGRMQAVTERAVLAVYKLVDDTMGKHNERFAPYIGALFCSSVLGSLASLTGFLRSSTADLWALMTTALVWYNNIKNNGFFGWLKGFTEPVVVMTPMNIISEIAQPISMSFRHFGNIAGGSVLTALIYGGLSALSSFVLGWIPSEFISSIPIFQVGIPAILSIYFDLFTGCIQALVFCMLTMVYVGAACPRPEAGEEISKPRFEIVPNTTIFTGGNTQWIKQSSRPPLRSAQVSAWVWALSARQSAKVMPSVRLSRAWHVSRRSPIRCVPT